MTEVEQADKLFADGYNCAQSVIAAFGPSLGLPREECLRISVAFGGGMGRQGEACGAVTGALLAIGQRYGAAAVTDPARKTDSYAPAALFIEKFRALHGDITCRALLGVALNTPEGREKALEQDLHHTRCAVYVHDAAVILAEMLDS